MTKTVIQVGGMSCEHCVNAVKAAIEAVPGVKKADVNLKKATATVKHAAEATAGQIKAAITAAGYTAGGEGEAFTA